MIENSELKALVKLLDDDDLEVVTHVEEKIKSIGAEIIPYLEKEWESAYNLDLQNRIEEIIHNLQFELLYERFVKWKKTGATDLLKGLWILSTYQYPNLDYRELIRQIEQLYQKLKKNIKIDKTPTEQIQDFNQIFFRAFKFKANSKNLHSPANSMINMVLESKKGNPASLCSIYLILAQRMNMPVYGVNLPNLFILAYKLKKDKYIYINVFNHGLVLTRSDIDNYLENLQIEKMDIFYEPCSHIDIVIRMLRNLLVSFEKSGDYYKSDEIKLLLQKLDEDYFSI